MKQSVKHRNLAPKQKQIHPLQRTMSQSVSTVPPSSDGIYEDVERQLNGMNLKARKPNAMSKREQFQLGTYLERGSPEGPYPAVKVDNARLGMVGKSGENRRGLDVYEFTAGSETTPVVRLAVGLRQEDQANMRKLMTGVIEKLKGFKDPMTKSIWYQSTFSSLTDGTKVYNSTGGIEHPSEFLTATLDDEFVWDSPSGTWAPFLYGEEPESTWYIKPRLEADAQVYLYTNTKKGCVEIQKTSEEGQVVYPKGGVPVKNTNMLKTLLSSKLYSEKMWQAKCIVKLTSINLRCSPAGSSAEGGQKYCVYPVFNFSVPTAVVLVEYDPSSEDVGGITDKQRMMATRSVLFEGLVAPKPKRKARETTNAPVFNKAKKHKKNSVEVDLEDEEEEEELDTDGEE